MSDLRLARLECRYPNQVQDELLEKPIHILVLPLKKSKIIYLVKLWQRTHQKKCPLESRKIESKIEKRKLLGIRTPMTYGSVQRDRNKFHSKSQGRGISLSSIRNCKYCGKCHNKGNSPAFGKKCGKDNHFKSVCKSSGTDKCDSSRHRPKYKGKGRKFHDISGESNDGVTDDLAEQVQFLFYNDVHYNAVDTRIHTSVTCETSDGWSSDHTFKVDTGADGNLMPISMFTKFFPQSELGCIR